MARQKVNSEALKQLGHRVNGLKAIKSNLKLNHVSVQAGEDLKNRLQTSLDEYNLHLAELENKRRALAQLETEAKTFSKTVFYAVKAEFGDQSAEYGHVGGQAVRKKTKIRENKTV